MSEAEKKNEKPLRLKVMSNGMPMGTRIEDENGNRVAGVRSIEWRIDLDSASTCVVTLVDVELHLDGEVVEVTELGDTERQYVLAGQEVDDDQG